MKFLSLAACAVLLLTTPVAAADLDGIATIDRRSPPTQDFVHLHQGGEELLGSGDLKKIVCFTGEVRGGAPVSNQRIVEVPLGELRVVRCDAGGRISERKL